MWVGRGAGPGLILEHIEGTCFALAVLDGAHGGGQAYFCITLLCVWERTEGDKFINIGLLKINRGTRTCTGLKTISQQEM